MLTGTTEHLGTALPQSVKSVTATTPRQLSRKESAENVLWSRMLRLAIQDALGCAPLALRDSMEGLQDDALSWIQSDQDGPGSFKWVCGIFHLSHGAVREAIMVELNRRDPDNSARMGKRIRYWTRN